MGFVMMSALSNSPPATYTGMQKPTTVDRAALMPPTASQSLDTTGCPDPARGVCDVNAILQASQHRILDAQIEELEEQYPHNCGGDARGFQVAVHIIKRLPYGDSVGDHATFLFNSHGVGHRPCNNGLLLLLAVEDRKSAIRTGKGTQRVVTDAMINVMLGDKGFKKRMRDHDYAGGVQYILDQIISPLQENEPTFYYKWINVGIKCLWAGVAVVVLAWGISTHHASKKNADFVTKLQKLQATRERNAKKDSDVTTAPCTICLEELPKGLDFSQSARSSGNGNGNRVASESAAEILRCGHVFHEACIDKWFGSGGNDTCPICRKQSPRFPTTAGGGSSARGSRSAGTGDGAPYSRTRPAPVDDDYYAGYYENLGRQYSTVPGARRMRRRNPTWSSCKQRYGEFNLCADYDASEAKFQREEAAAAASRARASSYGESSGGGGSCDGGGGGEGSW